MKEFWNVYETLWRNGSEPLLIIHAPLSCGTLLSQTPPLPTSSLASTLSPLWMSEATVGLGMGRDLWYLLALRGGAGHLFPRFGGETGEWCRHGVVSCQSTVNLGGLPLGWCQLCLIGDMGVPLPSSTVGSFELILVSRGKREESPSSSSSFIRIVW